MYQWIYQHFINTFWFIPAVMSLPFLAGVYIMYKLYMLAKEQSEPANQDENGQEGKQSNQDSAAAQE